MAICNSVQNIAASECIGDSLVKINNNFANLNTDACALLTLINQLSASLSNFNNKIDSTHPSVAKAWVTFDGTKNVSGSTSLTNTSRYILSSYNISSVARLGRGRYRVNFANTYTAPGYVVVASCQETYTIGNISSLTRGYYVFTRPLNYTNTSVDIRCGTETTNPNDEFQANNNTDVEVVSVVIFAN